MPITSIYSYTLLYISLFGLKKCYKDAAWQCPVTRTIYDPTEKDGFWENLLFKWKLRWRHWRHWHFLAGYLIGIGREFAPAAVCIDNCWLAAVSMLLSASAACHRRKPSVEPAVQQPEPSLAAKILLNCGVGNTSLNRPLLQVNNDILCSLSPSWKGLLSSSFLRPFSPSITARDWHI